MAKTKMKHPVRLRSNSKLNKTLKALTEQQKDRDALRKELFKMAKKALNEEFGTFDETFKAMLIEHQVMKKLVMDRLGVTLEEWNKTYIEIKEAQKK